MLLKQDTQTAYEELQQAENRVLAQVQTLNDEIQECLDKENQCQSKIDQAIIQDVPTDSMEARKNQIAVDRRRKEHQIEVLSRPSKGNQYFVGLAEKALDELAIEAELINNEWKDLITQLEEVFGVYLRACSKFKALEHQASRLDSKIAHAREFLPKGTGITHIETVPTRTVTNLQKPGAPDSLHGPIWMCARREGLMKIRDAYEGIAPGKQWDPSTHQPSAPKPHRWVEIKPDENREVINPKSGETVRVPRVRHA